jgi:CheY-like chemotaxis protein
LKTAYLIHWNAEEAKSRVSDLRRFGFKTTHILPRGIPSLKVITEKPPSVVVIDLSRLPSQGRDIAIILRKNGRTRNVPLVFVGGEREKIARTKKHLPDATYASWNTIRSALRRILVQPKTDLVVPKSALAGYSGTPLPKKLGIQPGSTVALIDAPEDFEQTLDRLPEGVKLLRNPRGKQTLTLWFTNSLHDYQSHIRNIAALTERVWIIWPKQSSGVQTDLSERNVREVGLAVGLVDYKVCAVDATWSGLLFTHRKQ